MHCNEPIVPTFGRHSYVARATAICILLVAPASPGMGHGMSFSKLLSSLVFQVFKNCHNKEFPETYITKRHYFTSHSERKL